MISIVIPLHNKSLYVEQTLRSLTNQRYQNWEALVVENHSSDGGPDRVDQFSEQDSRVRLLRSPANLKGPGAARNFGLEHARGKWVLFLDADDLVVPEHLESLLKIGEDGDIDIVASDWREFRDGEWEWNSDNGIVEEDLLGMRVQKAGGGDGMKKAINVKDSSIAYAPWAIHCGLIRRSVLTSNRKWVEELDRHPSEDTAFWFRVLQGTSVAHTGLATALYRTETPNFRNTYDDLDRWSAALDAIHNENISFLKSLGGKINVRQAECLMRVWSQLGRKSVQQGLEDIAKNSYERADQWSSSTAWNSLGITLRRILGCRTFDRLTGWL